MKTIKNWQTKQLDCDDQRAVGYYNVPHVFIYNGREAILPSGTSDHIALFQHGDDIILLSSNSRYDYVGITVYDSELIEKSEFFAQDIDDMCMALDITPQKFWGYTDLYQAKILYLNFGVY